VKFKVMTEEQRDKESFEYLWHYIVTICGGFVMTLIASYFLAWTRVSGSRRMHNQMVLMSYI
jgi:hypothetical protein